MIRGLLFLLFLYILLAWVIVLYLFHADTRKVLDQGLFWTAAGIASLLLWLIVERLINWWRVRRVQQAAIPVKPAASARPTDEDSSALAKLLNEAGQRLLHAPSPAKAKKRTHLTDLPWYLIVGPAGAGKTAVFHYSGIEPSLLAGQAIGSDGVVTSTRLANLWLANECIYLEIGGGVFNAEPAKFTQLLEVLKSSAQGRGWKSWLKRAVNPIPLRGVLLVFDSREFAGTPEPSKLDRLTRHVRERLFSIGQTFRTE